MRVACPLFPGTNGDRELGAALRSLGAEVVFVDHRVVSLPPEIDWIVLAGGFAHGDALRAGALAARSPIVAAVRRHAEAGGFVLGICNGFQILCEAKLLPGLLAPNLSGRFVARDALVEAPEASPLAPFFETLGRPLRLPIAHATGRFELSPAELLALEKSGGVALRYVTATDPNPGATGVAGVFGGVGGTRILGLMPHPERRMDPGFGAPPDGRLFFEALLRYDRARP